MRAIAFLLTLALARYVCSSHLAWQAGKQYTYEVRSRIFTGPSDINTQFAGLQIEYQTVVTVTGQSTLHLKPQNVKVIEANTVLKGGWRESNLINETPVGLDPKLQNYLESPITVQMREGIIESIKVADSLPTWAVNIKKAQVSYLVQDSTGVNVIMRGNSNRRTNSVRPTEAGQESGLFYETLEETVLGKCQTYYTISQNGAFEWPFPFQKEEQAGQANNKSQQEEEEDMQNNNRSDSGENDYRNGSNQQKLESEESSEDYRDQVFWRRILLERAALSEDDIDESNQGELPWPKAFAQFCNQNDLVFEILKSVNFTTCSKKPTLGYASSPGVVGGRPGDNSIGSALSRALVTRTLACGKDRKQFTILQIEQNEQVDTGLRLDSRIMAGTVQNVTLLSIQNAQNIPADPHTKTIQGLSYTFDPKEQERQREGDVPNAWVQEESDENDVSENSNEENGQPPNLRLPWPPRPWGMRRRDPAYKTKAENEEPLPQPDLKTPPLSPSWGSPLHYSGMQTRIITLIQEIKADILTDKESIGQGETLSKIITVAEIVRQLNYTHIMNLHNVLTLKSQTDEDQTTRSMFRDAVSIAGTNPAVLSLIDLIKSGVIKGAEAAEVILTLPLYVRTPTKELLKYIFENLLELPMLERELQVKTTAFLSFSNLLFQAWVDGSTRNGRYPVALYGEFGNQKDVQQLYAPFFIKNLKLALEKDQSEGHNKHWTLTCLKSLGNLGTPEIIPLVQRILDDSQDAYLKTTAVFALSRLILSRSGQNIPVSEMRGVDRSGHDGLTDDLIEKQVLPVLVAVAFDKGEHPEVRMAAISLLLYTTSADITIWQQMAYSTWFETSQQVHSFVYTSLKSLTKMNEAGANGILWRMNQKAHAVLPLAKPSQLGLESRNIFHSGFIRYLQSSSSHHISYFGSEDSTHPSYMYYQNHVEYGNGGFTTSPIQISTYGHILQNLAAYALSQYQNQNSEDQEPHRILQMIRSELGIEKRGHPDEDFQGSIDIKMRDQMQRFYSINQDDLRAFARSLKNKFLPQLASTGIPFNHQKTVQAVEHNFEFPTALGIPLTYNFQMPVLVSLRGLIKLVATEELIDVQIQGEFHPIYAYKTHIKLGFNAQFIGKTYESGLESQVVLEHPCRFLARSGPSGQLEIAYTPSHLASGVPAGKLNLVTYQQKPYTAILLDTFWPTSHREGGQMVIVHPADVPTPYRRQTTLGQKEFGLAVQAEEKSDYWAEDEAQSSWIQFWQRFHSESCFFNLGWLGSKKIRYIERTISIDISKSDTKSLVFLFGGKRIESITWRNSESRQDTNSHDSNESQPQNNSREEENQETTNTFEDFKDSLLIAVGLFGKPTPVRSVAEQNGRIQKLLEKGTPTTAEYFLQTGRSEGKYQIIFASGDATVEAARNVPEMSRSLKLLREVILQSPRSGKGQPDACVELEGIYVLSNAVNNRNILTLRKQLLAGELVTRVKGQLQFGRNCSFSHEIQLRGILTRGPDMTEYAKSKSPEAQKCAEDERKGFSVSPVCMRVAELQAAALDSGDFVMNFNNLPKEFLNGTGAFEDLAKAYLYPYMSSDRSNPGAGDNKLKLHFQITPDREYMDIDVIKPHSRLSFKAVRMNRFLRTVLPLTATQTPANNMRDRVLHANSDPSCSIQGNFVSTFDNMTYRFFEGSAQAKDCYHVLAQDCSGQEQVSILAKNIAADKKKIVIMLESQTRIEIAPEISQSYAGVQHPAKPIIKINGKPINSDLLPRAIRSKKSGELIARIERLSSGSNSTGGLQILTKTLDVATDFSYIVIFADNQLRNRTCGLCGDFNGEKSGEMKSPKNCPLSSGSAFVASYAIKPQTIDPKEQGNCKIDSKLEKQIDRENSECTNGVGFNLNHPRFPREDVDPSECADEITPKVRRVVFNLVNTLLKPYIWNPGKRQQYANQIADKIARDMAEFMKKEDSALKISERIANEICKAIAYLPDSEYVKKVCEVIKPLFAKYFVYVINPFCQSTGCCKPSYSSGNPRTLEYKMMNGAEGDEDSEEDPTWRINLTATSSDDQGEACLAQLQVQLPKYVAKVMFMVLQADAHLSESDCQHAVGKVALEVQKALKNVLKEGQRLSTNVMDSVERTSPAGYNHILRPIIKDLSDHTLRSLQEARQCVLQGL